MSTSCRQRVQGVGLLEASPGGGGSRSDSSSPSAAGARGRMAGRGGQRCEDAAARTLVEVRRERPSAPASGRPPAPPRQRFPGLLDGAGRGPAPLQSSRRYWSAGSALSPCGPIRARHEKRPIGRARVSVPLGRGGSRDCEIRARPSRAPPSAAIFTPGKGEGSGRDGALALAVMLASGKGFASVLSFRCPASGPRQSRRPHSEERRRA